MTMNKLEEMGILLDFYGCLLTEKQYTICDLYYNEDFSLFEIAESLDVSRAAVSDHLKRSNKLLLDYEEKLHLLQKYRARKEICDKIVLQANEEVKLLVAQLELIENK